ncbi:serine/threonine-protein kinase [Dolichospermum sp. UHCC 0684]|uniref:serine/threonine-protein kinase n=1 Tax=unclassified Dolichospermum TaxID=2622029 RepID=UPI001445B5D6|nr:MULTISPECIES: serine/threonine-protein kinase [unclassified Dolichospermum]MEA5528437.1 serine/threonine-protein kinase [Dolichospermum sp. UHCC 0684]MTJ36035.1 protein kinase [Dolichospermum sp. UHCC 0260]
MDGCFSVHCINPHCQRPYPQPWGNKFCNSCGAPLHLLNRYFSLKPLGAGGFAQIYTIWDEKTQTEKVLKVLVETSPKALELFKQEAEVLSSFRNSGVPTVDADGYFQINLVNPKPYQLPCLVMEKINGYTLEEVLINSPQGCSEDLVIGWFIQAVQILQELHQRQIIHRDIKPSNLMLRTSTPATPGKDDKLVLIDFGGAKQFSGSVLRSHPTSTRLYSSGYSPYEQIRGGNVGPAADFYALGRTIIQLLTGKYPPDLEDSLTGKLRWRNYRQIKSDLADLIDEMVQDDPKFRPADAAIIHKRLIKIASLRPHKGLLISAGHCVVTSITDITQFISNTTVFIIEGIYKFLLACLATIWVMILTSICAGIGTIIGFVLAYHTSLGARWLELLAYPLPTLVQKQPYIAAESIVYGFAGLGTGWGLTLSGCFGQKRRFLITALMGLIGYSLGWIACQFITTPNPAESLVTWILISLPLLTLGLGLRSHQIAYAVIAGLGSANLIAIFVRLGLRLHLFHFSSQPQGLDVFSPIVFFSLVSILISFSLSISHYLVVPSLRWLGWR